MSNRIERTTTSRPCLLVIRTCFALGAFTLPGCGAKVATDSPTETGNPPVIDESKIRVVAADAGVRIVGEAGSVPADAEVTVTNVESGATAETEADDSGAFDVLVGGATDDQFEVSVRGTDVTIVAAHGPASELATCDDVFTRANELRAEIEAFSSQGCTVDADCIPGVSEAECSVFVCGWRLRVAKEQRGAVIAAVTAAEDEVCPRDASLDCLFGAGVDCAAFEANYALACVEGACVDTMPRNPCSFAGYNYDPGITEGSTFCGSVAFTNEVETTTSEDLVIDAFDCFREAFTECRSAVLRISQTTVEGDPINTDYYIPVDPEVCEIQAFDDSRNDRFGVRAATRRRCTSLEPHTGAIAPEATDCETLAVCEELF